MGDNLEEKIDQVTKGWIARAFKEERMTIANHLLAAGVSIVAATGFSYFAPGFIKSDAAISGIATGLDITGYWAAFLPQLLYRDRRKLKGKDGKISWNKTVKKIGEYMGYMGIVEGAYAIARFFCQYELQKKGWDPATASATIQLSATALLTFVYPPLRYAVRQWSEK